MACTPTPEEFFAEAGTLVVLPATEKGEGMFEEKDKQVDRGVVVSKGVALNFELAVPKCEIGDTVLFGDYAGKDFKYTHKGDKEPTTYKVIAFGEAKVTFPKPTKK